MASGRGTATRKRLFAVASRCDFNCRDVWPAIAPRARWAAAWAVLQIARRYNCAADLPDVSKCFRGITQSIHASDHHATLHGVVFDILVESENRVGLAAVFPVDDRGDGLPSRSSRAARPAFAERLRRGSLHSLRERRQDSNLQPDRYEREDTAHLC